MAEVARLHGRTRYVVLATGFAPGFAYLGDVDPRIAVPRLRTPRGRVATPHAYRYFGLPEKAGPEDLFSAD